MTEIFLLHAYSPKNSGDGLLIKLSIDKIRAAGLTGDISVVCLDTASFIPYLSGFDNVKVLSIFEFLINSLKIKRNEVYFFGVGGGYLRSGYMKEGFKATAVHGLQLFLMSFYTKRKSFYFPQSIGPLNGFFGKIIAHLLKKVDVLCVRDDKSKSELDFLGDNVYRMPDLVADKILNETILSETDYNYDSVCFVFRDLPTTKVNNEYIQKIKELYEKCDNSFLALQSDGRGNNDKEFYKKVFGLDNVPLMKDVLAFKNPIVVSVRLHGSLESILNRKPSYHLAYERKGFAAYNDLGLDGFVQHVSNFNVNEVIDKIKSIMNEPKSYWEQVEAKQNIYNNKLSSLLKEFIDGE